MSMDIEAGDYVLGIWALGGQKQNWLCIVTKRGDKWRIQYRFRYYEDDKAFGSKDRKKFFGLEGPATDPEEKIIKTVNTVVEGLMAAGFGDMLEHELVRSDKGEDFMAALKKMKCMNMKVQPVWEQAKLHDV